MYWIGLGLFALGTLCGTFLRFPFFAMVLFGAIVVAIASVWTQGAANALLDALISAVVLQVGYAAGIGLRAALRSFRRVSPDGAAVTGKRAARFPPGQNHN